MDTAVEANETFTIALYTAPDWLIELAQARVSSINATTPGGWKNNPPRPDC